jgi:ribosomal-protein-serine acetyltransferase
MFKRRVAEGIELRQLQPEHAPLLFAVTESNRAYLREWLPWVDRTQSPEDPRRFIVGALADYQANRGVVNAGIWLPGAPPPGSSGLVGCIGTHAVDEANRSTSIGYWMEAAHQGKGVMTRSCACLLDYLFDEIGLHRVEIRCGTGNAKSCAIPERLGFSREGVLQEAELVGGRWLDLVVWSMLEQNWRSGDYFRASRL